MTFVDAWDKKTGEKLAHPVPAHWLTHPKLGENLTGKTPKPKTPKQSKTKNKEKNNA